MTAQQYLEEVLAKYHLTEGEVTNLQARRAQIEDRLKTRFPGKIEAVYYSGSYAKGTAINSSFDLDICPYFKRTAFETLREMYFMVLNDLKSAGYNAEQQT